MKKQKTIIMWIFLIILTILILALNYIKFFGNPNQNIKEQPIENSSSTAINNALLDITNNFNNSVDVQELTKDSIVASATLKNYSIFISYTVNESKTTYEFKYSNLKLTINISNDEENIEKFNKIYKILIKSCQKRLNNSENINEQIDKFLNGEQDLSGITKTQKSNLITYEMDITQKISNQLSQENNNQDNSNSENTSNSNDFEESTN